MALALDSPLSALTGVGPARARELAAKGVASVEDLLYYLPFRYEDRTRFVSIGDLQPGEVACVRGEVKVAQLVRLRGRPGGLFHLVIADSTGLLYAKWFHSPYLQRVFRHGQSVVLYGKVEADAHRPGQLQMIQPQHEVLSGTREDSTEAGRIVPIYEAAGGVSSRVLRRLVYEALGRLEPRLPDPLPEALRRRNARRLPGYGFEISDPVRESIKKILPFHPTEAQKRVLKEIAGDLQKPAPMNRLLQGDVGSGKTIVAFEAAVIAMENGAQVALMAPTEILATQHYLQALARFARTPYRIGLLISELPAREKRQTRADLAGGDVDLVVGTHALLEKDVEFHRLGLVIVDEQHRFGVLQRLELIRKGREGLNPHVLVMTATPIPRTLALALYSDLEMSVLDELPPGRTPIETRWVREPAAAGVWEFIRKQVTTGRQAYIVYPVIDESKQELKAATKEYERLSREVFQKLRVGLLHGRLKGEQKEAVMREFAAGKIQILVATSVVEVGVDVPNATVMVIEHAERFGLSQLHQLRGRIGRGRHASTCVLMTPNEVGEEARQRLETLVATQDGFKIAELDLKLRGPGEFIGTRQHGYVGLRIANLLRDAEWLERAKRDAFDYVAAQPLGFEATVDYLRQLWRRRYRLADVA